ncbi:calcium-binding protein [Streptomyces liangshanensis]|uniref:Calcium-binding protein n=1 Tax=Streptomyces liangshanensis TaxID=2717324 RepID=A0A6G9H129_9ACTN|nr:calcium-binding protein [Streptomyces liangshanensis]QIQ04215.1 calcium-binding protein [Streptomyces liangshanensis]
MRIRATVVAAASGALALSAFAVPASQAAQQDGVHAATAHLTGVVRGIAEDHHTSTVTTKHSAFAANKAAVANKPAVITKASVNGGKAIVVTATETKARKIPFSVTATDASGVVVAAAGLWSGTNDNSFDPDENSIACKVINKTTTTCTGSVTLKPTQLKNVDATAWHVLAVAFGNDDNPDVDQPGLNESASTVRLQRASQLTVDATPEPVKKGKTITVNGKLTRADWQTNKNAGYGTQPVKLQFRKKTATTYTTVKTVKTSSTGVLKTTVTASVDGYYRWSFAGTTTTPAVNAAGDAIDVK